MRRDRKYSPPKKDRRQSNRRSAYISGKEEEKKEEEGPEDVIVNGVDGLPIAEEFALPPWEHVYAPTENMYGEIW